MKAPRLPAPSAAFPAQPILRSTTYASLARAADRALAKAEEAVRTASLIWADIDSGLETGFDELAEQILEERRKTVDYLAEVYADRLAEHAS